MSDYTPQSLKKEEDFQKFFVASHIFKAYNEN